MGGRWVGSICVSGMYRFFLVLALLLGSSMMETSSAEAKPKVGKAMERLIWRIARQEGIDPYLLKAIISVESAFNPSSISSKGAVGLMQLMPATARELGVTNRFNPEQNLRGGARYLKKMLERFSDITLALAAYNAGPANVARFKGVPPFPETRKYVGSVMRNYAKINPGSNMTPRRIYRLRRANGTVVLTDSRRILMKANWERNQKEYQLKRTPHLSIKRRFASSRDRSRVAPLAKPRLRTAFPGTDDVVSLPISRKSPIIRTKMRSKSTGQTFSVITNRPIVQLASSLVPIQGGYARDHKASGKTSSHNQVVKLEPPTSSKARLRPIIQANITMDEVPTIRLSRQ